MTVKIIDGFVFDCDRSQYILYRVGMREKTDFKTRTKTGEMVEYKDTIGYYADLKTMLNAVLNIATKEAAETAGIQQIGDYLEIMRDIKDEIGSNLHMTAF